LSAKEVMYIKIIENLLLKKNI